MKIPGLQSRYFTLCANVSKYRLILFRSDFVDTFEISWLFLVVVCFLQKNDIFQPGFLFGRTNKLLAVSYLNMLLSIFWERDQINLNT